MNNNVSYSTNSYDYEGDAWEKGIYLHFGEARIRVAENIEGYKLFVKQLEELTDQIELDMAE